MLSTGVWSISNKVWSCSCRWWQQRGSSRSLECSQQSPGRNGGRPPSQRHPRSSSSAGATGARNLAPARLDNEPNHRGHPDGRHRRRRGGDGGRQCCPHSPRRVGRVSATVWKSTSSARAQKYRMPVMNKSMVTTQYFVVLE